MSARPRRKNALTASECGPRARPRPLSSQPPREREPSKPCVQRTGSRAEARLPEPEAPPPQPTGPGAIGVPAPRVVRGGPVVARRGCWARRLLRRHPGARRRGRHAVPPPPHTARCLPVGARQPVWGSKYPLCCTDRPCRRALVVGAHHLAGSTEGAAFGVGRAPTLVRAGTCAVRAARAAHDCAQTQMRRRPGTCRRAQLMSPQQ